MSRRDRLRREAIEAATWRGHQLGKFWTSRYRPFKATANCLRCCCTVTINTRPEANEIDMAGDAVAVGCRADKGAL